MPTVLFKDSVAAANGYIYIHSVNCHRVSVVTDDNSILRDCTMVTITPGCLNTHCMLIYIPQIPGNMLDTGQPYC